VPDFLVFDVRDVDMVEKRSLGATLEASDRESSGLRGRPSCDGGIGLIVTQYRVDLSRSGR
jgi:hypothetical protein